MKMNYKSGISCLSRLLPGMLFVLLFASWSSPLFKYAYGCDSSFYSMVGRSILEGKVPYRDYFDIKGPVFFFWEAFGQLLHRDRMGVFLLELICAGFVSWYLYKIAQLFQLTRRQVILAYLMFFFCYGACLWGGNTAEEFCLPLNLACIYQAMLWLKEKSNRTYPAYLFGLTIAICFLSKATVAAPMFSATLVVFIYWLTKKRFKQIGMAFLFFAAGIVTVAVPVCVYFTANDAFSDFISCVFQLAGNRAVDYYVSFSLDWELHLLPCYVGVIYFLFNIRRKGSDRFLILALSLVCFALLHLGSAYDYYFITELPLTWLLIVNVMGSYNEMVEKRKDKKVFEYLFLIFKVGIICLTAILVNNCASFYSKAKLNVSQINNQTNYNSYQEAIEVYNQVPENERDDLYSIESDLIFFEINQTLPTQKYCNNLTYFCSLVPEIEGEVIDYLEQEKPTWIVMKKMDYFYEEAIKEAVQENYYMYFSNDMQELWKHK